MSGRPGYGDPDWKPGEDLGEEVKPPDPPAPEPEPEPEPEPVEEAVPDPPPEPTIPEAVAAIDERLSAIEKMMGLKPKKGGDPTAGVKSRPSKPVA